MTYQEVPADKMTSEEEKVEPGRKTEKVPLKIDESLFMDKVKEYNPVSIQMQNEDLLSSV